MRRTWSSGQPGCALAFLPARDRRMRAALYLLSGLLSIAALPAHAALGGDVASVLRDHQKLQATDTVIPTSHYDVHGMNVHDHFSSDR